MPIPTCTTIRIDHLNQNGGANYEDIGQGIYDASNGAEGSIYFVYLNRNTGYSTSINDIALWFRRYDIASETFDAPVLIDSASGGLKAANMRRLSSGRLLICWRSSSPTFSLKWAKSDGNGASGTWTAPAQIDTTSISGVESLALADDGTDAYLFANHSVGGGAGDKKYYIYKYTAASSTWGAGTLVYSGTNGSSELYCRELDSSAARTNFIMTSPTTGVLVVDHFHGASSPWTTDVFWTVDGTSWNTAVLLTSSTNAVATRPWMSRSGTRIAIVMQDLVAGASKFKAIYTDDVGVTWSSVIALTGLDTAIGSYVIANDARWSAILVSPTSLMVGCSFVTPNPAIWAARGPLSSAAWTVFHECNPTTGGVHDLTTASTVQIFQSGNDAIITTHFVNASGGSPYYSYEFEVIEGLFDTTPPPCVVVPLAAFVIGPSGSVTICGPLFPPSGGFEFTYAWTGPGGFTATTRCITVSVPGTYNLVTTSTMSGIPSFCSGVVISLPEQPPGTRLNSIPFHRGVPTGEPSGHPAGNESARRVGD